MPDAGARTDDRVAFRVLGPEGKGILANDRLQDEAAETDGGIFRELIAEGIKLTAFDRHRCVVLNHDSRRRYGEGLIVGDVADPRTHDDIEVPDRGEG